MALLLLSVALPAVASAAECTDTWTGPAEGTWTESGNWSGKHVPSSTDVACIPKGKKALVSTGLSEVGVVQGEGTVSIFSVGNLKLLTASTEAVSSIETLKITGGTLSGPGVVNVTGSFSWTGASTMSGSGATVVKPGATAELSVSGELKLSERKLINEGSTAFGNGAIVASNGAVIENSGTFKANSQWGSPEIRSGEGVAPKIINTGNFEKTSGKEGSTTVGVYFENKGVAESKSANLSFTGGGSASGSAEWKGSEGARLKFTSGSYALNGGSLVGLISVEGGTVTAEGVNGTAAKLTITNGTFSVGGGAMTIATLSFPHGTLAGAGTLNISETLTWTGEKESTMSGSGNTVLKSGATAELSVWGFLNFSERKFVNEGTVTFSNGAINAGNGAIIENLGTFYANSQWGEPEFRKSTGAAPQFVNAGTFAKTVGSGTTHVGISVENLGKVEAKSGNLSLSGGGSSKGTNEWTAAAGKKIAFTGGSFSLASGKWSGAVEVGGAVVTAQELHDPGSAITLGGGSLSLGSGSLEAAELSIGGGGTVVLSEPSVTSTVAKLKCIYGTLTGAGTLNVSENLAWTGEKESTMSGTGKTVVQHGATGELSVWGLLNLSERTFVNEGAITFSNGALSVSKGATIRNSGTFYANSEWQEPEFRLASKADSTPRLINTGNFEKTSGKEKTVVEMNFENLSNFKAKTGSLTIQHPVKLGDSNQFGKRCKSGDPVDCATGNFSESQADISIGGRGVGLSLTRSYSAQTAATASGPGAFGYGWSVSFSDHLTVEEAGKQVTLTQASGATVPFTEAGKESYAAPAWSQERLAGSVEAGYTLTLPNQTTYGFSGSGRLESISDRNGNATTLAYNKAGQLESISDPAGRQITFSYNGEGFVESAKDPIGNIVKYTYEGKNLKSVTLPGEAAANWQFKYDASHRLTLINDGRGGKTSNEYDGSNRVITQTDPAGRTLTFKYESLHTTITNKATGAVTSEWFTSNNEPFSITRGYGTPSATTESFSYNAAGQLTGVTDANGHTTTYGYDGQGNRTSERNAAGEERKWGYNATHDVLSETTPRGEVTTIERDSNGNIESVSRPGPEETTQTSTFEYDGSGQPESVTDPLNRTWSYGYDSYGNRTSETDPAGDTVTFGYDKDSRLTSLVTPRGNVEGAKASEFETIVERDAQGREKKVTDALGHVTEYTYDANSNLTARTDSSGHTTKYVFNADDEQTKVEKPNGAVLETGYDGAGEVTSQTDANKHATTYVRNVLEEPIEVIDPLGRKTIEEFDPAGNLKSMTDPAERKATYGYDLADRPTEVNYSEEATPDAKFEYDADGKLTGMNDGTGKSRFVYDQLGRLTESEDGHGDVVGYGYDLAEEQTGLRYPNGEVLTRKFDPAGRLESISDWLGGTTTFAYDADSNLEGITFPVGTGNADKYAYDHGDRMSVATFSKGAETLASLSYGRDKIGQVEKEIRKGLPGLEETNFSYDKNDRLIGAGGASYEYDPADNLTKAPGTTNTYDAASQLEAGTGLSYGYDKLGERIKAMPSSGPATTYKYDQAGRLVSVQRPEEGELPPISETFAYDGSGLLASKTSGLGSRYLTWDSSTKLPLLLDDGQSSYIYGPDGLPVEQISGENPTYLHHDQLGSTRLLTNASGEADGAFSYGAYGSLEGQTGVATTALGFAGQYTDAESGLQYLRARFYDPATAQFLTKDPFTALTRSPYGYANENPSQYVDPSGRACIESFGPLGRYPNLVDCFAQGGEELLKSPATGPLIGFGCLVLEPCTPVAAILAGILASTASNLLRAEDDPCFDLMHHEIESLLVLLAGSVPGGLLATTSGRAGEAAGLTPLAERILHIITDAPGLALEVAHAMGGG